MAKSSEKDARIAKKNKDIILKAAMKAFAKNGFKGTSVQQIAADAGLPKTNVLYYFKSKQDLYTALIEKTLSVWNSAFDKATVNDDPAETLAKYITEKMEISRVNPNASKVFAIEIINGATNLSDYFQENHYSWLQGRVSVIQAWMDAGKMRASNAEYLLYHIWACTQHYADFSAQINSLRKTKMRKADFDDATRNLIYLILTGCGLAVPEQYRM